MYRRGYILLCFYSVKTAYLPVGHHQLQYLQTIYRHFHSIQIGNVTDDIKISMTKTMAPLTAASGL